MPFAYFQGMLGRVHTRVFILPNVVIRLSDLQTITQILGIGRYDAMLDPISRCCRARSQFSAQILRLRVFEKKYPNAGNAQPNTNTLVFFLKILVLSQLQSFDFRVLVCLSYALRYISILNILLDVWASFLCAGYMRFTRVLSIFYCF